MNKRAAKARAQSGEVTIGELRRLIAGARGRGGMSRVNPQFTVEQVLDIFERALEPRADDEKPPGMRPDPYSSTGRMKPSRDSLTIYNVLRECAP